MSLRSSVFALAVLLAPPVLALQAFPPPEGGAGFLGAQGFGSDTIGGRGGVILYVNTLDDHDDGTCDETDCTLREALNHPGPRIVLFEVGGTIVVDPRDGLNSLVIDEPFITIAGQSAPGPGIELRNEADGTDGLMTGHAADSFETIVIDTNDVVIRHLRIRPGPLTPNPACTEMNAVPNPPGAPNGATCLDAGDIRAIGLDANAADVVLDHLSLSWASDEIVSFQASQRITLQNSILSEGLNYIQYDTYWCKAQYPPEEWEEKCHPESFSGKGVITGDKHTAGELGLGTGPLSFHHNAFVNNSARNPQITTNCLDPMLPLECAADTVNNVVHNWWKFGLLSGNVLGHHYGNVVGNFIRPGANNPNVTNGMSVVDYSGHGLEVVPGAEIAVYHAGNVRYDATLGSVPLDPTCTQYPAGPPGVYCSDPYFYQPAAPFATPSITATSADTAYADVLADAGASWRLEENGSITFNRDANDARVIAAMADPLEDLIDSYAAWVARVDPPLDEFLGTPSLDSDRDGMPDAWEVAHCMNHTLKASPFADNDGDGYTDVEEFLNGTPPVGDADGDDILDTCDVNCDDGVDNDGDGKIDYPEDDGCASLEDPNEGTGGCGLLGIELLPLLAWIAVRRRRSAR